MQEYKAKYKIGDCVLVQTRGYSSFVDGEIVQVAEDEALRRPRDSDWDIFYRVRFNALWRRTKWVRGDEVRSLLKP